MSDHDDPVARGYRDEQYGQALVRERVLRDVLAVMSDGRVREVYARNGALTAAGAWLVVSAVTMALVAFTGRGDASRVIVAGWATAPVAALVGWIVARARATAALRSAAARAVDTKGLTGAGDEVTRTRSAAFVEAGLNRGRAEGIALAGLSLMAPLGLHLVYRAITGDLPLAIFGVSEWMRVGVALVGHCHLVLAFMGWRYTRRVALADPGHRGVLDGLKALGVSSLLAVIPSVKMLGIMVWIAVALVGVTGAAFVPLAWWWATRRIRRDRAALDAAMQAAQGGEGRP